MPETRTLRLIVNGKVAAHPALRPAVADLRGAGHRVEVRITWEAGDATIFARKAALAGIDAVVAAGGDGTLNEVVNGVCRLPPGQRCAVGVIPLGTANDFANAFFPAGAAPAEALALAARGTPTLIDVGRLGSRAFLNVASGGFGAEITAETPPERKQLLGRAAYLITGLTQAPAIQARPLRLQGPGFSWQGKSFVFAVGNGRQAGGGFQVCPGASLTDGLLDVFVLPEVPLNQLFPLLRNLLRFRVPLDHEAVVYGQYPWLTVEADEEVQVNLDGEPLCRRSYRFTVEPRSLPFFLP